MVEIKTHRTEVVHFKLSDVLVSGVAQNANSHGASSACNGSRSDCVLVVRQTRHEAVWLGGKPYSMLKRMLQRQQSDESVPTN